MKTKLNLVAPAARHSFCGAICTGAVLLIASGAQAQNLFVGDPDNGNIYEYTPAGVQSTFASGLNIPSALAFNSAGDLFAANTGNFNLYKFTPGGVQSTFASGLLDSRGLAVNSAGDLFVADFTANGHPGDGIIYKFTPSGVKSNFATGLNPGALAFQGETLPVPEPSALGLLATGVTTLLIYLRKTAAKVNNSV